MISKTRKLYLDEAKAEQGGMLLYSFHTASSDTMKIEF